MRSNNMPAVNSDSTVTYEPIYLVRTTKCNMTLSLTRLALSVQNTLVWEESDWKGVLCPKKYLLSAYWLPEIWTAR
jgi:hypothetical protein